MRLFVVYLPEKITNNMIYELMKKVSEDRLRKAMKYKKQEDVLRSLVGEILVRKVCIDIKKAERITFATNYYGKPFIIEYPDIHFNISHSKNLVICGIDKQPLGIDIEYIQSIDLDIAREIFSKEEYQQFIQIDSTKKLKKFYEIWTLKESYIKAIGKGLLIPLQSFTVQYNNLRNIYNVGSYNLKSYDINNKYKMGICSLSSDFPKEIERVEFGVLIK